MDDIDLEMHLEDKEELHDDLNPTTRCHLCLEYQALVRERDARIRQYRIDSGE
jgi:hypothetical protein